MDALNRTFYFIRHGDYDIGDSREDWLGKALLPHGREQAHFLGKWFAQHIQTIDSVFCSDFSRAQQTAEILCEYLPGHKPIIQSELRECMNQHPQVLQDLPSPWLEDLFLKQQSATSCGNGGAILFVCHANLIRYFIARWFSLTFEDWKSLHLGNCSISSIQFFGQRFEVDLLAYEDHLPPSLIT